MDSVDLINSVANATDANIDPALGVAIAQGSDNVGDATTAAQATLNTQKAIQWVQQARIQDKNTQRTWFNQLSPTDQQVISSFGYKPPAKEASGLMGVLHAANNWGNNVMAQGAKDVGNFFSGQAKQAADIVGSGLRASQHVIRTEADIWATTTKHPQNVTAGAVEPLPGGASPVAPVAVNAPFTLPRRLFRDIADIGEVITHQTPKQLAQSWNTTEHGEHYVLPEVKQQVVDVHGPLIADLANRVISGEKFSSIVQSYPAGDGPEQQQGVAKTLTSDPDLVDAVNRLQAGKVSLGRMFVGADNLYKDPEHAGLLSGEIDGIYDWYADPANHLLEAINSANEARYVVKTAEDVFAVSQKPAAWAKMNDIAADIATGDASAFRMKNAAIADQYNALRAADATTPEKVTQYFANKVAESGIIAGRAGSAAPVLETSLPHLTWAGQTRLAAKGALSDAIDYLADTPARIKGIQATDTIEGVQQVGKSPLNNWTNPVANAQTAIGRTIRAATTIVPDSFNAYEPAANLKLADMLTALGMPKANTDQIVNLFANTTSLLKKGDIYVGAMDQAFHAAGMYQTSDGAKAATEVLDNIRESIANSHLSFGDTASMTEGVRTYNSPLTPTQAEDIGDWQLPSYKTTMATAKRVSVARSTFGVINQPWVDAAMTRIWKLGNILRLGAGGRLAGDEAMNYILREGLDSWQQGFAANRMAEALNDTGPPGAVARLISHIPSKNLVGVEDKAGLFQAYLNDFMARAGYSGLGDDSREAMRIYVENGGADNSMFDKLRASNGNAGGYVDDPATLHEVAMQGKATPLTYSDPIRRYNPTEEGAHLILAKQYAGIAKDPLMMQALESQGGPDITEMVGRVKQGEAVRQSSDRLNQLADAIQADPKWGMIPRAHATPGGAALADNLVTERQLALNNAQKIMDHVDQLTTDAQGRPVEGIRDYLLNNGHSPTPAALAQIPVDNLPQSFYGPSLIPVNQSGIAGFTGKGMDLLVGRPMDALARGPEYLGNYIDNMTELRNGATAPAVLLRQAIEDGNEPAQKSAESTLHLLASQRAYDQTIPFVHQPELRSALSIQMRNLWPYQYAQEQFIKRWAKAFYYSPEAIRQAQLTASGLMHFGLVHKDPDTGQTYFDYPMVGAVQDAVTKAMGVMHMPAYLSINPNLRGNVMSLSPGTERLAVPSLSPFGTISLDLVTGMFPELKPLKDTIVGPAGANQSFLHQILPTTMGRIADVITSDPSNSAQYASAMNQAMAYLESTGHGLPETATLNDKKQWMARLKNWTRAIMVTRVIYGFSGPASPENQINPDNWNQDFTKLLNTGLSYDNAMKEFMKVHPDARADTIYQSASESGAPIPSTDASLAWMQKNADFLKSYPFAGAWFIPQSSAEGPFSQPAYTYSLAENLRTKKSPDQFYNDIKFAEDAPNYFNAEADKNAQVLAAANNPALKKQLEEKWTADSQYYLSQHPVFAAGLTGSQPTDPLSLGGKQLRTQAIGQMQLAITDPRLPQSDQTTHISQLFTSYIDYQNQIDQYSGNRTAVATKARAALNQRFADDVTYFVQQHPDVQGAFNKLIRPDISQYITKYIGATS